MQILKWLLLAVLVAGAAILILRLVFPLPDVSACPHEAALPPDAQGRIGRAFAVQIAARPGQTGVVALGNGHDALASRLTLADLAETSIDAQYYICTTTLRACCFWTRCTGRHSAACGCGCFWTTTASRGWTLCWPR